MFELYFGAFDLLLYAGAFLLALYLEAALHRRSIQPPLDTSQPPVAIISAAPCPIVIAEGDDADLQPIEAAEQAQALSMPMLADTALESDAVRVAAQTEDFPTQLTECSVKPQLSLDDIKLYKLHKRSVVKVSALPFSIPDSIRRYLLRGEPVVMLTALEKVAVIA